MKGAKTEEMHSPRWWWSVPSFSALALLILAILDRGSVATGVAAFATGASMLLIAWRHGVTFLHSGLETQSDSPTWFWLGVGLYGLLVCAGVVGIVIYSR